MKACYIRLHFLLSLCYVGKIVPLKIDRVILAVDANQEYIQFWPFVAKAWERIVGVRPTLALIADDTVTVDENFGDVIRFAPIPNIPTSLQAQVIRLLLPALFPNDICIISDIDMLPLERDYYTETVKNFTKNKFVVYRSKYYKDYSYPRFPMLYNVGLGKLWGEIFNVTNQEDIYERIIEWHSLNLGWSTDERVLAQYILNWPSYKNHCVLLDANPNRIHRGTGMKYSDQELKNGNYTDCHMLRPYEKHKKEINYILSIFNLLD